MSTKGPEIVKEVAKRPDLDEFYRRNPHEEKADFFERLVETQRRDRAFVQVAREKRKEKKQGLVAPDSTEEDNG